MMDDILFKSDDCYNIIYLFIYITHEQ